MELIDGSSYLGQPLPFSIPSLILIEALVIGYTEFQRNAELDPEKRLYPGGTFFDPLNLAAIPEKKANLQTCTSCNACFLRLNSSSCCYWQRSS
ncbi:hypothetical protein Lal_00015856 [Lupinus albus]|uniref:Putative chlorophyll A-B binding protein n=1 Tax=Lupinus albus TaxID=3870 RepID=A0A6A5MQX9_LUPAL|nr:putative chlorophyll A-B binding protein [Lupinus albus]KAF1877194.1 hypothetical protein Lal_00015856 [Lupinus albus]